MADSLDQLAAWAAPLLAQLTPAARRAAMREVAKVLRQRQAERIKTQQNPDGTPYEARRPRHQLKAKAGAIRRDMFARMRRPANLRMSSSSEEAAVFINPRAAATARVHQYGLRDKVDWRQAKSPTVRYARRELLGFSSADIEAIAEMISSHIENE
ncbi:phage virion morphogenesis protein [Paracidovorax wautersii]|uniref:phage virion morphogenesis protein n=1 Tax=Paracidovorax wautersii TaxID=1177982 RepID=UPI0031DEB948